MADIVPQKLGLLAKLVLAAAVLLIAGGVLWHGVTWENWHRFWQDLAARPGARMTFRFVLQPAMATLAAIRDGVRDARVGRAPYFWTVLSNPQKRVERLNEGLNATARIIVLGVAMDVVYQFIELNMFYPIEALFIALLLAFVPYLLLRGPVERIARWRRGHAAVGNLR